MDLLLREIERAAKKTYKNAYVRGVGIYAFSNTAIGFGKTLANNNSFLENLDGETALYSLVPTLAYIGMKKGPKIVKSVSKKIARIKEDLEYTMFG